MFLIEDSNAVKNYVMVHNGTYDLYGQLSQPTLEQFCLDHPNGLF
jgi:hypothetical protein